MHTLFIHRTPYPLPSTWQELTRQQVISLARLVHDNVDTVRFAKIMFLILTQSLPWWKRIRVRFFYLFQATVDERADMLYLCRSFLENRGFTDQKIKNIGGRSVLFGPSSALANLTLWEYIRAEQAFLGYVNGGDNPDPKKLDKLVAILYRPARPDYDPQIHEDRRVPLVDAAVDVRLAQVAKVDIAVKIAILMWFDSCRSLIIKMYPAIFRKAEDSELDKKLRQKSKAPASSSTGWLDLITSLSADMTQFEKIGNTNLMIAFTDLSNRIRQAKQKKK